MEKENCEKRWKRFGRSADVLSQVISVFGLVFSMLGLYLSMIVYIEQGQIQGLLILKEAEIKFDKGEYHQSFKLFYSIKGSLKEDTTGYHLFFKESKRFHNTKKIEFLNYAKVLHPDTVRNEANDNLQKIFQSDTAKKELYNNIKK